MAKLLGLVAFLLASFSVGAATLSNVTVCQLGDVYTRADNQCTTPPSLGFGPEFVADAQSYGSIAVAGNTLSVSISESTFDQVPQSDLFRIFPIDTMSQASFQATEPKLLTVGPIRQGLVTLTLSQSFALGQGAKAESGFALDEGNTGSIPGVSVSCDIGNPPVALQSCEIGSSPIDPTTALSATAPIALGEQLYFNVGWYLISRTNTELFISENVPLILSSSASTELSATFSFFEADGVTPVSLIDETAVPEPRSLALCVLLALLLLGMKFYVLMFRPR